MSNIKKLVRKQFKRLFRYSLDLIYVYDLEGNILDVNNVALNKFGYNRQEISKVNLIDLLDKKQLNKIYKSIEELLKKGEQIKSFDYKIKKKKSGYLYINAYGIPIKIDGRIRAILGIGKDITASKNLNEKLKKLVNSKERELNTKQIYYNKIFENANDLIAILDENFKHEYVNNHYEKLLGYTNEELIGKHPTMYIHSDDIGIARKTTLKGAKKGTAKNELRYIAKNGDISWFELKGKFFRTLEGKLKSIIISRDITERKEAEKILKKSEKKYRRLFKNIPEGFAFHKMLYDQNNNPIDYVFLEVNPAFEKITGLQKKDILGKKITNVLPDIKYDSANWIERYGEVALTGKPERFESYSEPLKRWYNVLAYSPMKDYFVTIFTDITQKKKAENKLKESQKIVDSLANQTFVAIVILQDDRIKFWNREFLNQTGYSSEEVEEWNPGEFIKIIHPDDRDFVREQATKKQMGIDWYVENYEFRGLKKTGETYWCEIYSKSIKYNGRPADLILTIDITQRKKRQKELKNSEEKYRILVEKSPYAIILLTEEGTIADCNPATYKITSYNKEEFIGKKFFELDIFPNRSQIKELHKRFQKLSEGIDQKPMEFQIRRKDGKIIWVKTTSIIFQRNNQKYIQTILNDITEQRKREETQEEFNKELEKKVKRRTQKLEETLAEQKLYMKEMMKASQFKNQFMATMSHELRTPLNVIIGFSDLLLGGEVGTLSYTQKDYLKDVLSSAEHLLNMINEILDISKIDSGVMQLKLSDFYLDKIIKQTISEFNPLLKRKSLDIEVIGLNSSKRMYADPIKLKSVLYNIISNAIKFSDKGKISVEINEKPDKWKFKIADEGIGIAEEDKDIIFEEFKRAKNEYVRNTAGSGLGLPLTKRFVNLHGGDIWFESTFGKGTTFIFTIPKSINEKKSKKIEEFLKKI